MKIIINVQDPKALKKVIVTDVENGNLPTWELRTNSSDDRLLTHSAEQWADKVLLRLTPNESSHQLIIEPRYWNNMQKPTKVEYGTVLGRFCERLFVQYSSFFSSFICNVN